jgi:GNAT superfamily N-acetyltransferase
MLIRAAVATDVEGIMATHLSAIREICSAAYQPDEISAWTSGHAPPRYLQVIVEHLVFVALIEDTVVGFSEFDAGTGEVCAIFVAPARVRQGIGRRLLQTIETNAIRQGVERLHLQASLNSIGFYQAQGFTLDTMGSFRLRSGVNVRCAAMHKYLGGMLPRTGDPGADTLRGQPE